MKFPIVLSCIFIFILFVQAKPPGQLRQDDDDEDEDEKKVDTSFRPALKPLSEIAKLVAASYGINQIVTSTAAPPPASQTTLKTIKINETDEDEDEDEDSKGKGIKAAK